MLLGVVVAHDQLGIDEDVAREDESCDNTITKLNLAVVWEESSHKAEQDHNPDGAEQVWGPVREVVLALAGNQAQGDEDAKREHKRGYDDAGFVERDDDGDGIGFQGGKSSKESQVHGVRLALPEGEAEEDEGTDERHPHHPLVCLDPVAVCL